MKAWEENPVSPTPRKSASFAASHGAKSLQFPGEAEPHTSILHKMEMWPWDFTYIL